MPTLEHSGRPSFADPLAAVLPLPEGEGWGEGEQGSWAAEGYMGLCVGPRKR